LGDTTVAEFYQERGFSVSTFVPAMFPLQTATLRDLRGGTREENAATLKRILSGNERGPKRDAVLLNAAAALFVAGCARSIQEGWTMAEETIDSGVASAKLASLSKASFP
jgi:anthranilate phosphoribosyltransferase